jgi:hypothetical protein
VNELELTRMTERAEARVWSDCVAAAPPELRERLGLAAVPLADGIALVAANVPSILYNRAWGFGLDREVTEAELEAALARYRRDEAFAIQPTPHARPDGVSRWLEARGLHAWYHWVRWVRDTEAPASSHTALEIVTLPRERADVFARLAARIFAREPSPVMEWMAHTVERPGWTHYAALDGATPVGIASLYVADGVGWLGWGGTLESHRNRGGQAAMIARRIADARAAGCAWVTTETSEDLPDRPSPSYRNMARAGFRLLYLRPSHAHVPPHLVPGD